MMRHAGLKRDTVRKLLISVAALIFVVMVTVTIHSSLEMSLSDAWGDYKANPWAIATLYDAYSGFTLYWLWVAFRERNWGARTLWFILIMALGNIATSAYLLFQLLRLKEDEPLENVLLRRRA